MCFASTQGRGCWPGPNRATGCSSGAPRPVAGWRSMVAGRFSRNRRCVLLSTISTRGVTGGSGWPEAIALLFSTHTGCDLQRHTSGGTGFGSSTATETLSCMTEVGRRTDRLLDAPLSPEDLLRRDRPRDAGRDGEVQCGLHPEDHHLRTDEPLRYGVSAGAVGTRDRSRSSSTRSTSSRTARRTRESESTSPSRRPALRSTERLSAAEPDVSAGTDWRQVS